MHLAGESVAAGRWNAQRKARILNSRVQGTQTIAASMARANPRPRVLVSASANGIYGDTGDTVVTEAGHPDQPFWRRSGGSGNRRHERPRTPASAPSCCALEWC